jgi:hypothetical protein
MTAPYMGRELWRTLLFGHGDFGPIIAFAAALLYS